jgi:hypothetical protein
MQADVPTPVRKSFQTLDDLRQVVLDYWATAEDECATAEAYDERMATLHTILDQLNILETHAVQGLLAEWGAHDSEIVRAIVHDYKREGLLKPTTEETHHA